MLFYALFLLSLLQGFFFAGWLPWWFPALLAGLLSLAFARGGAGRTFLWGFLGVGGAWLVLAFVSHWRGQGILTARMAEVIAQMPGAGGVALLFVAVVLLGGLLGGLGSLSGRALRVALGG
jgi:hypothetical protein